MTLLSARRLATGARVVAESDMDWCRGNSNAYLMSESLFFDEAARPARQGGLLLRRSPQVR